MQTFSPKSISSKVVKHLMTIDHDELLLLWLSILHGQQENYDKLKSEPLSEAEQIETQKHAWGDP